MDMKKYQIFVKTAELSSLTQAAAALGITQSAVSHSLSQMESELALPLFQRSRSGARLTPEGAALLPHVQQLLRQEEALRRLARSLGTEAAGTLRIAAFTSVATHWLPEMMAEFQARYPKTDFQLLSGDYHDIAAWLKDGSADLGFVALPTDLPCRCIPLYEDALLAALPPHHPLAAAAVCPLSELAQEPFITLLESSDQDVRRALETVGRQAEVRLSTKDDYAVIAFVRQGLGVSIMPSLLLRGHTQGLALRPLNPPVSRTIALAVAQPSPGAAAEAFAAFAPDWVRRCAGAGEGTAAPPQDGGRE